MLLSIDICKKPVEGIKFPLPARSAVELASLFVKLTKAKPFPKRILKKHMDAGRTYQTIGEATSEGMLDKGMGKVLCAMSEEIFYAF